MTTRGGGWELPRPDDVPKLMLGATLTVAWAAIVDAISAIEFLVADGSCLSDSSLYLFNIGALAIAIWFGVLANMRSFDEMVASFVGEDAGGGPLGGVSARARRMLSPRLTRALMSPWIPVTCLFLLASWLIFVSGGTLRSPYSPVLLVMLAVGQGVYDPPTLRFRRDARFVNVSILVRDVVSHYRYPILLATGALVGPLLLGAPGTRHAPQWMTVFTSMFAIVMSMCAISAAKWRD